MSLKTFLIIFLKMYLATLQEATEINCINKYFHVLRGTPPDSKRSREKKLLVELADHSITHALKVNYAQYSTMYRSLPPCKTDILIGKRSGRIEHT